MSEVSPETEKLRQVLELKLKKPPKEIFTLTGLLSNKSLRNEIL